MENITLRSLEERRAMLQVEIEARHEAVSKKIKTALSIGSKRPFANIFSRISLILTFVEGIKIGRTIFRTISSLRK